MAWPRAHTRRGSTNGDRWCGRAIVKASAKRRRRREDRAEAR